jgi:hypothetical protein
MMQTFAPGLLSTCHQDASTWLRGLAEWNDFLREVDLAPAIPTGHWVASESDGAYPSFEAVSELLATVGLAHLTGSALQLLASLLGRARPQSSAVAMSSWSASGCFGAPDCPALKAEVVAVLVELASDHRAILGSPVNDDERFQVAYLRETAGTVEEDSADFAAVCVAEPPLLLPLLDPAEYWNRPRVGIQVALSQLGDVPGAMKWQVLPQLAESLNNVTDGIRRDSLRALALATFPLAQRPRGLDEHPLRKGRGSSDPQQESRWGKAFRATVRKHGIGWRVHYWRGPGGVTMSNLSPHDSVAIFS